MKKRDKKDIDWEDYELYDIEDDEESSFDFKSIIDIFRINWKVFALSMVACLALGVVFLKVKSPIYQVSTKMLIKEIDLQNYLFNTDVYELAPSRRLEISTSLRREMIEIFSGCNVY